MAKKTVITKVLDANAEDGIIEFPQNKTLYVDQFTDGEYIPEEHREGFQPKNMNDVFEHYQPAKDGVELEAEDNSIVTENFVFKSIKDFEDQSLIQQSGLLKDEMGKMDALDSVIRQLEKNKTLRNALKDATARGDLANALKALLSELEGAK